MLSTLGNSATTEPPEKARTQGGLSRSLPACPEPGIFMIVGGGTICETFLNTVLKVLATVSEALKTVVEALTAVLEALTTVFEALKTVLES